ncbi:MAG TPA: hypothetical protein VHD83_27430 [Puia sp.]|nr:hypothetical protein [Puia sp.]
METPISGSLLEKILPEDNIELIFIPDGDDFVGKLFPEKEIYPMSISDFPLTLENDDLCGRD